MQEEYISRINHVLDYIENNIDKSLTLKELANVAHFSPFHFHRLFGAIMKETLNQYIQRIRIEKSANLLLANPKKSITEIAYDCGFSSSATFARSFKELYDMSASQWRAGGFRKYRKMNSNNDQANRNIKKEFDISSYYLTDNYSKQKWRITMKSQKQLKAEVEVKDIPEMHVAYVRHIGRGEQR